MGDCPERGRKVDQGVRMRFSFYAILAATAMTVSACGSPGDGGETACGDFNGMSSSDQSSVIKDFLSEKGKSDPSNFEVGATRMSAIAYCKTAGSDSSPIKNIDG
jgi:acid stress chaperone HdeA